MLAPIILKYLNHKLLLAEKSQFYRGPEKRQALDWAFRIREYLRYQGKAISDRDLAIMIKPQFEHNLKQLLPCELNKSYQSSLTNYNKIKECVTEIFKPKQ